MKDYTSLYPGLTPRDAAIVYMHALHDRYMRRKPGVYDCGRPDSEQENGCAGCNLRKLLGQPAGFGGGCCGWALSGTPTEVAIEILETALAVEEENDSECPEKLAEEINEGRIKRKHIKDVLKDECGVVFGD